MLLLQSAGNGLAAHAFPRKGRKAWADLPRDGESAPSSSRPPEKPGLCAVLSHDVLAELGPQVSRAHRPTQPHAYLLLDNQRM